MNVFSLKNIPPQILRNIFPRNFLDNYFAEKTKRTVSEEQSNHLLLIGTIPIRRRHTPGFEIKIGIIGNLERMQLTVCFAVILQIMIEQQILK